MKPPMHDPITIFQPVIVDGKPVKDDQGFPATTEMNLLARVTENSQVIFDDQGQKKNTRYDIAFPPEIRPMHQTEVLIKETGETVFVFQTKARKTWSGKKVHYWVAYCGE
jgi:hypothetical protein